MSAEQPIHNSPRITALQKELEKGNIAALSAFWDGISQTHTPLIEQIENEPEMCWVTFLWRSAEEVKNVVLVSELTQFDLDKGLLKHMQGSDLWYLSLKLAKDLRTTYQFSVNDSMVPLIQDPDAATRLAAMKLDPFNPNQFSSIKNEDDPKDYTIDYSVLEMPDVKPQLWSSPRTDTPAGKVEMHRVQSKLLGNERRVWLYTPFGYDPANDSYPLLVIFDGQAYTQAVDSPAILDNLLADGLIPPFVAILVDCLDNETRAKELPCYAPFADFLVHELLPWARQKISFTNDRQWIYAAGSSYGGLAASFVAFRHPEVFGNVISQSGSYWWRPDDDPEDEWLTRQYALAPCFSTRFYMDVGKLETIKVHESGPNHRLGNRHMRDVLQAKGYPVYYTEYNGGHDYIWWRSTLADGLLMLLEQRMRDVKDQ